MDSFLRRLKYYGLGFGMGLIFVIFFFQNRGCSWWPSNRVKNSIIERLIVVSEKQDSLMKVKNISKKDFINALNVGDVNFSESKKNGDFKVYAFDVDVKGKNERLYFSLPKESFISEVFVSAKDAHSIKETKKGTGKIYNYPNESNLVYVDTTNLLSCQLLQIELKDLKKLQKQIKKTATIDFENSHFNHYPKPEVRLVFDDLKGRKIGANTIWYKNKINISALFLPFENDCEKPLN